MAWVNFREILDRFSHLDGELVSATADLTPGRAAAEVVVRFYPWWEHPRYVAAVERGEPWGFTDESQEAGAREVTVRAIRPWAAQLEPTWLVIDWAFAEQHPLLWKRADCSTIYVNGPLDLEALLNALLALEMPHVNRATLAPWLYANPPQTAPFALTLPAPLYGPAAAILERLGVPFYGPRAPHQPPTGVVFLFDGGHIIADDFEVDVPEFVHDPAWFQGPG